MSNIKNPIANGMSKTSFLIYINILPYFIKIRK
nr:MAG TPA: hypothetical protein [Caudoviricetes sp.]